MVNFLTFLNTATNSNFVTELWHVISDSLHICNVVFRIRINWNSSMPCAGYVQNFQQSLPLTYYNIQACVTVYIADPGTIES